MTNAYIIARTTSDDITTYYTTALPVTVAPWVRSPLQARRLPAFAAVSLVSLYTYLMRNYCAPASHTYCTYHVHKLIY